MNDRTNSTDGTVTAARPRAPNPILQFRREFAADVEERLKAVACHLFARRGVDGVTIREILEAAKVRNFGAIGYYFGSKEKLVRQILIDGAQVIDVRRGVLLDALEASDEEINIERIIDVLVHAVVDLPWIQQRSYLCFVLMLSTSHRDLYLSTMSGQSNTDFARCVAHLRRLMPPMPAAAVNQRLMFMKAGMAAVLARREAALVTRSRGARDWAQDGTLRHYIRSETVMLAAPYLPEEPPSPASPERGPVIA